MKPLKKRLIQVFMVLLVVGSFLAYTYFELSLFRPTESVEQAVIPVKTMYPKTGNAKKELKLTGFIRKDSPTSAEFRIALMVPEQYINLFQEDLMFDQNTIYAEIPNREISDSDEDTKIPLQLRSVAPFISPETRTFTIDCSFENEEAVFPGMFARVFITTEQRENTLTLPYSTLTAGNTLWYVQSNKAQKLSFTPSFAGDNFFVVPEEYASFQFIYEGQHFLKQDDVVQVLK